MQQQGSRIAQQAVANWIITRHRGWGYFLECCGLSEKDAIAMAIHLFRNRQKDWCILKRVVRHLERLGKPAENTQVLRRMWVSLHYHPEDRLHA